MRGYDSNGYGIQRDVLRLILAATLASHFLAVRENRVVFANAMHKVERGWTKTQVRALLGPPDDIWGASDPVAYVILPFREIWCYGTRGHLTLPVLGTISFKEGVVESTPSDDAEPPAMSVISDWELEANLRAIYRPADDTDAFGNDPLRLIRAANKLRPLGKEKALAVMTDYERLEPGSGDSPWLFWLTRVLFTSNAPSGVFGIPVILYGAPHPQDIANWPTYPVFLVDDIPISIARRSGSGAPESFRQYASIESRNWLLRPAALWPPADPFSSYRELIQAPNWPLRDDNVNRAFQTIALRDVLNLVRTGFRAKELDDPGWIVKSSDFERLHEAFLESGCHWSDGRQMYVRRDGSAIETKPKRYARQEFEFKGIPRLRLRTSLARTSHDSVSVYAECDEAKGAKLAVAVLSVVDASSGEVLAEGPANLQGNSGWGNEERTSKEWEAVKPHEPGFSTQLFLDLTAKPGRMIRLIATFMGKQYASGVVAP